MPEFDTDEPETRHFCLRYHAWAATIEQSPTSIEIIQKGSLGTNDEGNEIHKCLHADCSLRLGSKALLGTLNLHESGGIAACEMPQD